MTLQQIYLLYLFTLSGYRCDLADDRSEVSLLFLAIVNDIRSSATKRYHINFSSPHVDRSLPKPKSALQIDTGGALFSHSS